MVFQALDTIINSKIQSSESHNLLTIALKLKQCFLKNFSGYSTKLFHIFILEISLQRALLLWAGGGGCLLILHVSEV